MGVAPFCQTLQASSDTTRSWEDMFAKFINYVISQCLSNGPTLTFLNAEHKSFMIKSPVAQPDMQNCSGVLRMTYLNCTETNDTIKKQKQTPHGNNCGMSNPVDSVVTC